MLGRPTTHKVRIWAPFGPGALLAVLAIAWASVALPIHVRAKQPLGSTAIDAADFGGRAIRSELQQQVFRSAFRSVRSSGSPEPFVAPTVTRPCAREQAAVAAAICPAEPSGYLQRRTALPRAPPLLWSDPIPTPSIGTCPTRRRRKWACLVHSRCNPVFDEPEQ